MVVVASSRKNVAIRGLDMELYNEVFSLAKRDGKRVSDVVNTALKNFIEKVYNVQLTVDSSGERVGKFVLRNKGEITLSKNDIMTLRKEVGPFMIENSGKIVFEKDIDGDTIKNIDSIVIHDGTVEVPKTLYPQFLIRSEIHGKLEKY